MKRPLRLFLSTLTEMNISVRILRQPQATSTGNLAGENDENYYIWLQPADLKI